MTSGTNNSRRGFADWLLIAAFAAAVWLPLGKLVLTPSGGGAAGSEKRKLTPLPATPASWVELWKYPTQFSAYYRDNFGFRSQLIRAHAVLKYRALKLSPSRFVMIGRDSWLFYADDYSLEDYRSLQPFGEAELARWRRVLEERNAWLTRRGIRFLVVLNCDKHVIYPEFLPAGIVRRPAPYRVEELAEYLTQHTSVPVVALKSELEAAKQQGRIYHRTDSHWNDAGAYVGYREILKRLGAWFPQLQPLPPDAFTIREVETPGWDLAVMMGLDDIIHEQDRQLVPRTPRRARVTEVDHPDPRWNSGRIVTEIDDDKLPRAVVLRDSFGSALVPFLAEHFRRCEFFWQYEFEVKHVRDPKPDVVILLMASRRLQWYIPSNPPLP